MASQNIARLGVVLGMDTAEFTADIDKAIKENAKLKTAILRDTNAAAGEVKALTHATEDYGKALTKVQLIQRETTSGRFMNATDDMKKRLLDQAAAYDKVANVAKSAADAASKLAAQQNLIQRDSNTGLADITALRNATEDYGRTLTRVELIQREISSGKYANATQEIKNQLLQQAAAYDKVALAAKNAADNQQKLTEQQNAVKRDSSAAATEISNLKNATEDYGKTLTRVEMVQREITSGRFMNATQQMKTQLLQQAAAYDKVAMSAKNAAGATFKMNEQQKINLTYQTTDFFTQIASGQSPFIAAIQQGGQLKDTMGGVGNMFRAIGSLFTPFSVGLGTVSIALGSLGYALYKAIDDLDKFKDAMTLTGGFAGVTYESLLNLGNVLSNKTNASIGSARDLMQQLAASGKYTSTSIESVGEVILRFSKIAGVDAAKAAETLIPLLDGTASSAKQLNDKYHFLTLEQYKNIKALEKQGKLQESAKMQATLLNESLQSTQRQLGTLEKAWQGVANFASQAWDAMMGWGRDNGTERAKELETKINQMTLWLEKRQGQLSAADLKNREAQLQSMKNELNAIVSKEMAALDAAEAKAKTAAKNADDIRKEDKYGPMGIAKASELAKARAEAEFSIAKQNTNELIRLDVEMKHQLATANREMLEKNAQEDGQFTKQNLEIYKNKAIAIAIETSEKIKQIQIKKYMEEQEAKVAYQKEMDDEFVRRSKARETADLGAFTKTEDLEFQRKSLELKYQLIYATETEQKLAQISLEYARKRKELEGSESKSESQSKDLDRQEAIAKSLVTIEESGKRTGEIFNTVFSNMSSAIDNFVKTGKLSMKDFARDTIQSLIAIQMKAAALSFLKGVFGLPTAPGGSNDGWFKNVYQATPRATGGPVSAGSPYMVGERGPELFMPSGSGTIIPNNQISNMGATTNVTNYNINAIDTKSFEDRLLGSSNAIWAANQYANKSLAVNRGRA